VKTNFAFEKRIDDEQMVRPTSNQEYRRKTATKTTGQEEFGLGAHSIGGSGAQSG
jgi:hypothetical protein